MATSGRVDASSLASSSRAPATSAGIRAAPYSEIASCQHARASPSPVATQTRALAAAAIALRAFVGWLAARAPSRSQCRRASSTMPSITRPSTATARNGASA